MECLQRYPFVTAIVTATVLSLIFGFVMQKTMLDGSQGGLRAYAQGVFECFIFFAAFLGASAMGAAWLAFKVASKWKSWSLIADIKDPNDEVANKVKNGEEVGRQYRSFLVGTAGNLVIGLAAAAIAFALGGKTPWP